MTAFLGIDYGTKRIGLAIGDDRSAMASPVATVAARGGLDDQARDVLRAAGAYDVDELVVGLPMNMDDSEGKQARITRRFGEALARISGLAVHYVDERLSTHTAEELIRPAELTRKKRKAVKDAVAAQVILQSFFDERRGIRNGGASDAKDDES